MEDITGLSMKDCLSLPRLGWKYFNSLRTEEDEPIYTYNDKYMRWFVLQSIKEDEFVLLTNIINHQFTMMSKKLFQKNYVLKEIFMILLKNS